MEITAGGGYLKLGIFGSRTLKDDRVKFLILDELDKIGADTIVTTQEPLGVCTIAQNVAKEQHFILELHFLDFKYRTGAYEHRSDNVIKSADKILLIHDGESKGTINELERVKYFKKPYRYEIISKTDNNLQRNVDRKLETFTSDEFSDFNFDF